VSTADRRREGKEGGWLTVVDGVGDEVEGVSVGAVGGGGDDADVHLGWGCDKWRGGEARRGEERSGGGMSVGGWDGMRTRMHA
jgi:hypothetical protein